MLQDVCCKDALWTTQCLAVYFRLVGCLLTSSHLTHLTHVDWYGYQKTLSQAFKYGLYQGIKRLWSGLPLQSLPDRIAQACFPTAFVLGIQPKRQVVLRKRLLDSASNVQDLRLHSSAQHAIAALQEWQWSRRRAWPLRFGQTADRMYIFTCMNTNLAHLESRWQVGKDLDALDDC